MYCFVLSHSVTARGPQGVSSPALPVRPTWRRGKMDGTQLVIVQLPQLNGVKKAKCRERLHCNPKRCNLPNECFSKGRPISLDEARKYVSLTYCGSCLTTEDRTRLQLPERSNHGRLQGHEPASRPQEKAAVVSEVPPAQSPSASARGGGPERRPLRQDALVTWSLELAQREAQLKKSLSLL